MFRQQHMNMQCKNDKQNRKQNFSTKILPNRNRMLSKLKSEETPGNEELSYFIHMISRFFEVPSTQRKIMQAILKKRNIFPQLASTGE